MVLHKVTVTQIFKNISEFYVPKSLLQYSDDFNTGTYPESLKSNLHRHTLYFQNTFFIIMNIYIQTW
jgi:hypothetical protein